jgi:hypothetical protein
LCPPLRTTATLRARLSPPPIPGLSCRGSVDALAMEKRSSVLRRPIEPTAQFVAVATIDMLGPELPFSIGIGPQRGFTEPAVHTRRSIFARAMSPTDEEDPGFSSAKACF